MCCEIFGQTFNIFECYDIWYGEQDWTYKDVWVVESSLTAVAKFMSSNDTNCQGHQQ